jgi:hypothetical protein
VLRALFCDYSTGGRQGQGAFAGNGGNLALLGRSAGAN